MAVLVHVVSNEGGLLRWKVKQLKIQTLSL